MKKLIYGLIICLLLGICCWGFVSRADELEDIQKEIEKNENKQQQAEENAAWVNYLRSQLRAELDEAQLELDGLLEELEDLNRQASETETLIDHYLAQRVESEARLAEQKDAMALRIQYTYEQPVASYLEILLGSKSLSAILNSAEYISSMSAYDKKMMEDYQATLDECSENLALMIAEEDRLVSLLKAAEEKEAIYQTKTQEMLDKLAVYSAQVAAYSEQAMVYAQEVQNQQVKLEAAREAARKAAEDAARKRAEEEAARQRAAAEAARQKAEADARNAAAEAERRAQEEQARKEAEAEKARQAAEDEKARIAAERAALLARTPEEKRKAQEEALIASDRRAVGSIIIDPDLYNPSGYTNLELLAAIIDCEAGGQTYEGRVAVGNVIMNRILDPRFQTTIYDVVYGPGQFSPVKNGMLARRLAQGARESCVQAAKDVLEGVWVIPKEYLYFCTPEAFAKINPRHSHKMTVCWHVFYY